MALLRAQCSVKYMYRVCEKDIYGFPPGCRRWEVDERRRPVYEGFI